MKKAADIQSLHEEEQGMYKRILVPLDGSATSRAGLNEALKLAKNQKAELCLLHVVDNRPIVQDVGLDVVGIEQMAEASLASGKKLLVRTEAAVKKHRIPVKTRLVENNAQGIGSVIAGQARKCRANLIVIGTHGRQGVSRLVMGSDAESVMRESPVPVLMVRSKAP
jgi:nucleotide-binding universal stress UspA family protein